jgi:hypothetical protein
LSHIRDVEITGQSIKARSPRMAQSQCPDLIQWIPWTGKGIVRRNRVRKGAVHIEAKNLAQQVCRILRVIVGIKTRATIPKEQIKVVVLRAESHHPSVVIHASIRNSDDDLLAQRICQIRIGGRDLVPGHNRVARHILEGRLDGGMHSGIGQNSCQ